MTVSTAANRILRSHHEHLTAEVRALASNLGGTAVWIEKVVVSTALLKGNLDLSGDGVAGEIGRVLGELQNELSSLAGTDNPRLPELSSLRSRLRAADLEVDDALSDEELYEALGDAAEMLATLLGGEEPVDAN